MGAFDNASSIEGDVYVQRLATYIRRNEEALANGLLCFSKVRSQTNIKPLRPSFTTHHLYYITERIANLALDVDVGPLNVKLDSPNHEPTFISFMANNARSQRNFESDARSITSINSMKSIVSSASVYWMSFSFSKDPRVIQKDVKYLYSSFTKIPCLILTPRTKINSVSGYEEYPCDTSVPLKMFKNLQVLELVEYEPNEVYGWHSLSERLRILIIRNTKVLNLCEVLYTLVSDDEHGRSSFAIRRQGKRAPADHVPGQENQENRELMAPLGHHRRRAMTATSVIPSTHKEAAFAPHKPVLETSKTSVGPANLSSGNTEPPLLPASKWFHMKQLTVTESSITQIPGHVFRPLVNLVKLNLSNNLLESIPLGLLHLPHLKYLNLADNYITSTSNLPELDTLVTVNLNNNKISDIRGVERLRALEKIDLRRNKLKDLPLLLPLVNQAALPESRLANVFVSNNNLHRTYRTDLFNLFNGARPKNTIKIDDSRPGYFERAMLLDPESARKLYNKTMGLEPAKAAKTPKAPETNPDTHEVKTKMTADSSPRSLQRKNLLNLQLPAASTEKQKSVHKHSKSTGDVLDSLALLNIQDLENTFAHRKHASVMTTASSTMTTALIPALVQPPLVPLLGASSENSPTSPSMRNFSKTLKPLLPNANLCNQAHFQSPKMPLMLRHLLSPMIHLTHNGSSSTLKSSSTMTRIDLDSSSLTNLAPSVITPVQVQVEGFH